MRKILFFIFILALGFEIQAQQVKSGGDARRTVEAAVAAMGGESALRGVKSLSLEAVGHINALEQSERSEGPYLVQYQQLSELRDVLNKRIRQATEGRGWATANWSKSITVVADGVGAADFSGKWFPQTRAQMQDAEEWLALAPESILLAALDAKDLRAERDTVLQGVTNRVVVFSWQNAPVSLFLNANTNLPTSVEIVRPHPFDSFWNEWGDFPTRVYFSLWKLEKGGIRYPYQLDIERDNQPFQTWMITDLKINPEIPADSFNIPQEAKDAFAKRGNKRLDEAPLGIPSRPAYELARDFIQIPGAWNVGLIKQPDGIVVIEAPISSSYSAKVIAEAEKRFPGVPVKAVVTTVDAFPHIAGLREYAARGIPVYALDLNEPIIKRLLAAPYKTYPDALAQKPRKAQIKIVREKAVIGTGENRLEIYPIRGESSDRMLMIYAPAQKILYASDLVQPARKGGFFMPQYLSELADAVSRENLQVEKVFAMHAGSTDWADILKAVSQARQ
jgi:glyoxylase-like metal-dependent hydrolase (beta-lactamase superfamily II)